MTFEILSPGTSLQSTSETTTTPCIVVHMLVSSYQKRQLLGHKCYSPKELENGHTVFLTSVALDHNTENWREKNVTVATHTSNLSRIPRIYPCKFSLAGVNFYRFNAKNWYFRQITRKSGVFTDLTRKIGVFRCKFYSRKILPV